MRVLTHAYTEEDLARGLQEGTKEVIRFIYWKNLPSVKQLVSRFPAIILEADDVIQEGLTRLILNIREGRFSGRSSLNTYLYSICRNICLKESHRSRQADRFREEELAGESSGDPVGDAEEDETTYGMIQRIIRAKEQMESQCVDIIDARFGLRKELSTSLRAEAAIPSTREKQQRSNGMLDDPSLDPSPSRGGVGVGSSNRLTPFEDVAMQLGISADNARQRFKRCLERLIRLVRPELLLKN